MGSGRWSADTYHDRSAARVGAGKDVFDYSASAKRSGALHPHQTLDPQGLKFRESRDSQEHPASNAIIISLDVTGSMDAVVRGIHANLPKLHELLLGHHYISDPQILFAAVGDATCDRVPLQVGQFESDNRMDQNLENMILEGGGGGQNTESYELMMYVASRHTIIDCWEKRRRKGYLFIIGDETAYPAVNREEIARLIGRELQADIPIDELVAEVKQRFHLYFLIPGGAAHGGDQAIINFWNALIGPRNVIQLESPDDTSECIALAIGVNEGAINAESAVADLQKRGIVSATIDRLGKMLKSLVPGSGPTVNPDRPRRL